METVSSPPVLFFTRRASRSLVSSQLSAVDSYLTYLCQTRVCALISTPLCIIDTDATASVYLKQLGEEGGGNSKEQTAIKSYAKYVPRAVI